MFEHTPKILFIADEIPQSINAGSIQFLRLFKDYPKDRLLIIGKKPNKNAEILSCPYYELKFPIQERLRLTRFKRYLTDIQSVGLVRSHLPKHLQKIANDYQPDLVISLMQLFPFYHAAYSYAKQKNLPFYLFCHDDVEDFAKPHYIFRKKLININTKIYQYASKRLCISPEMAEDWELKYKVSGNHLYPTASDTIPVRNIEAANQLVKKNIITVGYAGSLAYGYREGINEIISVFEQVGANLNIYRNQDTGIANSPNLKFMGYANTPDETWQKIINECDAVILPYSMDFKFKTLYETHFPSKIPEYLKLNIPVIVNGPAYANGYKYGAKRRGFLTSTTPNELINILTSLKNNNSFRVESSQLAIYSNDFDSLKLFHQYIREY